MDVDQRGQLLPGLGLRLVDPDGDLAQRPRNGPVLNAVHLLDWVGPAACMLSGVVNHFIVDGALT